MGDKGQPLSRRLHRERPGGELLDSMNECRNTEDPTAIPRHISSQPVRNRDGRADSARRSFLTDLATSIAQRLTRGQTAARMHGRPGSACRRPNARVRCFENLEFRRVLSTFDLLQITDTTGEIGSLSPTLNQNGTQIAFTSDRNLVSGMNNDGNAEIFILDQVRGAFTQITKTTSGDSTGPALTSDALRVAFVSDADLVPGMNADGNVELFLYDTQTEAFTQITMTTGGSGARDVSISDDGRRIAFISDRDLVGGLNPDGNDEVFSYDRVARSITQITLSTGGSGPGAPSVSADGNWIALTSNQDLLPGSNTDGNSEVFLYDQVGGDLTQVTSTTGETGSLRTSLDEDGTRLAFDSDRDLVAGQNSDNNFEIFFFQRSSGNFSQVTNTTGGTGSTGPALSDDGTRLAFSSDRDIVPDMNTGGENQVFVYDRTASEFTQVTEVAGGTNSPSQVISANGARVAFASPRDILPGNNSDTNLEIFLGGSAIDIEKSTNGHDADESPGPAIPVGNTVTWTYRVTNPSLVNLTNVAVTDSDLPNGVAIVRQPDESGNDDDTLEPFEVWIYQATSTASLMQFANTGTVTAKDTDQQTVNDSDDSHYVGSSIEMQKSTNGQDADTPTGPSTPVGTPVTWSYRVTNPSQVDLINVAVTDPDLPDGVVINRQPDETGDDDDLLEPGEVWLFQASSIAALGQFSNMGTATALDPSGNTLSASDASHYVGTAIVLQKLTNDQDADIPPGPSVPVGDTVTWTYLVTNPTVVNLRNVLLTDPDLPGGTSIQRQPDETGNNDNTLEPGEVWRYEATSAAVLGQYSNTATVSATDPADNVLEDSDTSHYVGTAIELQKSTNGQDADVPTGPSIPAGAPVTWAYRVTNPSIVNLTNVDITDSNLPEGTNIVRQPDEVGDNDDVLEPDEVWLYRATGSAAPGQFTNVGTVSALDPSENTLTDSDTSHYAGTAVNLEKSTNGEDADELPGPSIPVGDAVTWSYRVTNPSVVSLTNVQVVDPNLPSGVTINRQPDEVGDDDDVLEPGEIWLYEAVGTAELGPYTNTGTVTAIDSSENNLQDSDTSHYVGTAVDLEKSTNGQDADEPTGPIIRVGDTVTWTYRVTNPNLVDLTDVAVTDPDLPAGVSIDRQPDETGNDDEILNPGEVWLFQAIGTAALGQFVNTGTVTAVDPSANVLTDSDASHYVGSAISLEKSTNDEDADQPTGPTVPVGNAVTWTYSVSNPSPVHLINVQVVDPDLPEGATISRQADDVGNNDDVLEPGEVWRYEATGTAEFGQFTNTGTASALDPAENTVEASDASHYFGTAINLQKSTNGQDANTPTGPLIPVGSPVTWTYRVTNPNPVNLTAVEVVDDDLPSGTVISRQPDEVGDDDDILEPDEVWLYEASAIAELGQFVNTGTVSALDPDDNVLQSSDVSHYLGTAIDLEKLTNGQDADDPTGPAIRVGDTVTWTYLVANPSLVNLTDVTVTDTDLPLGVNIARLPDETGNNDDLLEPEEVWRYEAIGAAVLGQFSNTGTATALDPAENQLEDSDASHYVGTDIDLKKFTNGEDADEPTGPIIRVGDPVTWTYHVTNPSPVDLTDVQVVDADLPTGVPINRQPDEVGNNDNVLNPGEVWLFAATTAVPAEGQYVNTGIVTALDPSDNVLEDSDVSHYLGKNIAGLQGFVYIDANDNGLREPGEGGVPGILVSIAGVTAEGAAVGPVTAMTDDDGSYAFIDIPPGTYELSERQAFALIDGKDTLGTLGGTVEPNRFFEIVVPINVIGEEYNFGELGLKPQFVSRRLFLASAYPIEWYFREAVAKGEESVGETAVAQASRNATIASTVTAPPVIAYSPPAASVAAPAPAADVARPQTVESPRAESADISLPEPGEPSAPTILPATRAFGDIASSEDLTHGSGDGIHEGLCSPVVRPLASQTPAFDRVAASGDAAAEKVETALSEPQAASSEDPRPAAQTPPAEVPYGPRLPDAAFQLRQQEYLRALDEILAMEDWTADLLERYHRLPASLESEG